MFHWGCSFSEYAGMMSFVFTKPSLNLFLPFKNCSRVHLWRLPADHISGPWSICCIKIQPIGGYGLALPSFPFAPSPLPPTWSQRVQPGLGPCSAPSSCVTTAGTTRSASSGLKENNTKINTSGFTRALSPLTSNLPEKVCLWSLFRFCFVLF